MEMTIMQERETITCPRPDKRKLTREEAEAHVKDARRKLNPDIRAYQCACGDWHVGKNLQAFNKRIKGVVGSGNHKRFEQERRNQKRGKR
jgi:hypothetical protein